MCGTRVVSSNVFALVVSVAAVPNFAAVAGVAAVANVAAATGKSYLRRDHLT